MRRRKMVRPINLRLTESLRAQLEAAATARRISTNQLMRELLEDSGKPLVEYLADFERRARDIIERKARDSKDKNPEEAFRRLATLGGLLRKTYTDVELLLLSDIARNPELRVLMLGAPQEQEKGGKS